jgi:hypothetical protein
MACFAPVNSTFESARLLERGEIDVQASISNYSGQDFLNEENVNLNNNAGFAIGYGFSDRFNMKLRYERIKTNFAIEVFGVEFMLNNYDYLELGTKVKLYKDIMSFSMPLFVYLIEDETLFGVDPRFFLTTRVNENFEVTVTPKAHIFFTDEVTVWPAMSIGFGISKNLKKWAIRPEFGYDGYLTVGLGANIYLSPWSEN